MGIRAKAAAIWRIMRAENFTGANTRDFEGASTGRRLLYWGLSQSGPNHVVISNLSNLRARIRELIRNNGWISGGVEAFVDEMVGRGLTPRWKTGDTGLDTEIKALWELSQPELIDDDALDFYAAQALIWTMIQEAGEAIVKYVYEGRNSGLAVPLRLQILEPDHFYDTYDQALTGGGYVKSGIEFDARGRRAAFRLWRYHPGEYGFFNGVNDEVRVPIKDALHIRRITRAGQIRGLPYLSSIILRVKDLADFEDAELVRKKLVACISLIIETAAGNPTDVKLPGIEEAIETTAGEETMISMEPGTVQYTRPGERITQVQPSDIGGSWEPWAMMELRGIAKGMGITYEQLTGDLRSVNFSSIRQGIIAFRRRCRRLQSSILIHQFCKPAAAKWLDMAVLSGAIRLRDYTTNRLRYINTAWDADGWEWVDPSKDVSAEKDAIRSGLKTLAQSVGERGRDIDEVITEIAETNRKADASGILLDTDPRAVSGSGVKHQAASVAKNTQKMEDENDVEGA